MLIGDNEMTIQQMCKEFREKVLQMTLQDVSYRTKINIKTISAFENGRSTNIDHLFIYIKCCDSQEQRDTFNYNLKLVLNGDINE